MRTSTVPVEASAERGMLAFFNRHKQLIFFIIAGNVGMLARRRLEARELLGVLEAQAEMDRQLAGQRPP